MTLLWELSTDWHNQKISRSEISPIIFLFSKEKAWNLVCIEILTIATDFIKALTQLWEFSSDLIYQTVVARKKYALCVCWPSIQTTKEEGALFNVCMSLVSPHVTQNWLNYVYEVAFFIFVHVCFNGICIGMLFFENLIKKECAYSDMISLNCTYCTSHTT